MSHNDWILIFSNVGAIGLNLTATNIVILLVNHGEGKGNMSGQFLSMHKAIEIIITIKNTVAGCLLVAYADTCTSSQILKVAEESYLGQDQTFFDINTIVLNEDEEQQDSDNIITATCKAKGKAKPQFHLCS
ncbi:hypothetical protein BDR05DRAFT_950308 [Suillus weaverae]|nr:hypothetical protein BDR05DRAFT_950308 [Suillus weaverae]